MPVPVFQNMYCGFSFNSLAAFTSNATSGAIGTDTCVPVFCRFVTILPVADLSDYTAFGELLIAIPPSGLTRH